jgi:hypothetical protein
MKYDSEKDELVFESSGLREYCHDGMIGISVDGRSIGYGSDGGWMVEDFSDKELNELADHMIQMWQRLKDSL